MKNYYDVIVVGSGAAGLSCALKLNSGYDVCLISKKTIDEANSYLAQGGISIKRKDEDLQDYIEDTLKAGHYENDFEVVEEILKGSPKVIEELINYGILFDKTDKGEYSLHKEGGHKVPRVYHVGDYTGRSICESMAKIVGKRPNLDICEDTTFYDLIIENQRAVGIKVYNNGEYKNIYSRAVVLATGGIGGLFNSSTNYKSIAGNGISIALKHGIKVENIDCIQIHPTSLYTKIDGRKMLITEALRGEGGILLDNRGNRFIDELLPRDIVSQAIKKKMDEDDMKFVYLSLENIKNRNEIYREFPTVFDACKGEGIDIREEMIPVCPSQHYHMGGIKAKVNGRTSLDGLYAIGEVACTGFHGKNRLASNSLLEACLCGIKSAEDINGELIKFYGKIKENNEKRKIEQVMQGYHNALIENIRERNNTFYEYWLKAENA
ncbi:L-aspartate oxidase [Peptostreptococcus faecalis]|uniref:L-aspartate oxidase n=1 Tax=Peptostreptococcus faecalis TaxID=2045015 RepID=UPI000C7B1C24|nr:L-aspartate oxidase [Peptostreptococcus faecalis]